MPPPPADLTVPMVAGDAPASPNGAIPARPGEAVRLRARLDQEYVAGSGYAWYAQYLRALPWPIDELTADFGDDLYERMLLDAQVSADVTRFKAAILEDGATLTNAITDETADGYALGAQITDTLTGMLADLDGGLDEVLWNLLDAVALGNKVAEQVYDYQTLGGKRLLALTRLSVKPRRTTAFVIDAYNRVVGLLGVLASGFSPVQIGTVLANIQEQPNLIPREKFAVLSWRPLDGDPRGSSLIRPGYKPWWVKQQVVGDFLKFLAQFAGPSALGFTPVDAQAVPLTDSLGNPVLDVSGNPVLTTPENAMLAALEAWRNGTAAAFPGGASVELVQSSGEGQAFLRALQWCNQEIGKAITTQSLATEEGQHDSRAAATVHQDALDTIVRQGKRAVQRMLRYDILRRLVLYNWGEAVARKLTPTVSLGSTEAYDWARELDSVAHAYAVGYIGESQKAKLDERMNLPKRDLDYDREHAAAIVRATPARVTPIEGEPPQPDIAQQAKLAQADVAAASSDQTNANGQPPKQAAN